MNWKLIIMLILLLITIWDFNNDPDAWTLGWAGLTGFYFRGYLEDVM